ncbi:MAG: MFS transporter [Methanomassiliicoccus sp.]|nr:MFS transporter [Methanomassiliicoccus sp.]
MSDPKEDDSKPNLMASVRGSGNEEAFGWRFTAPVFLGSSLNSVNSSLIATALISIASAIHVSIGETVALVAALYLASTVAQPTAGKLSEVFGPRRVFLAGMMAALIGGLVGGFGHDLTTLIASRVLIGIGTSTGYPSAMLLVRRRAEWAGLSAPPGGVLGGLVVTAMVTPAIGLPLGGLLVAAWGWQAVFLVNVPLALITLCMTAFWIPRDDPIKSSRTFKEIATRIDLGGIIVFSAAMSTLLVFLLSLPTTNWISLGLAIISGLVLVWWELRASHPFIDIRLLATNRGLTLSYLRFALASLCVYTVLYGVTQWTEVVRGISAEDAGLLLVPMTLVGGVLALPISRRNLVRAPLIAAAVSCLIASIGVLFIGSTTPILWVVVITSIFGITLGASVSANQTTLYTEATADQIGTASGLLRTFGYIGSIASSALISIFFHQSVTDDGLHTIALVMVILSFVGLVIVLADRRIMAQKRAEKHGSTSKMP